MPVGEWVTTGRIDDGWEGVLQQRAASDFLTPMQATPGRSTHTARHHDEGRWADLAHPADTSLVRKYVGDYPARALQEHVLRRRATEMQRRSDFSSGQGLASGKKYAQHRSSQVQPGDRMRFHITTGLGETSAAAIRPPFVMGFTWRSSFVPDV